MDPMPYVEPFLHSPLSEPSRCIRILRLPPGPPDKRVHFGEQCYLSYSMHHCSRDTVPAYITLSYAWADMAAEMESTAFPYSLRPATNYSIAVDGKPMQVTANLHAFLHEASKLSELRSQYLWIDQLCIDQSNIIERNAQVAMMGSIYAKAYRTIIWLGKITGSMDQDIGYWMSVLTARYWTRLWIVQELAYSSNIAVMLDERLVPWSELFNHITDVLCEQDTALEESSGVRAVRRLQIVNQVITIDANRPRDPKMPPKFTWTTLLKWFEDLRCSDLRDKVYALRSLATAEEPMEADYGISVEVLFDRMCTLMYRHYPNAEGYYSCCKQLLKAFELLSREDVFVRLREYGYRNPRGARTRHKALVNNVRAGVELMASAPDFVRICDEIEASRGTP